MKNLLAYCIVSHDRPGFLRLHLQSISSFLAETSNSVSLYVFDNSSTDNALLIRALCLEYGADLIQKVGATVNDNFLSLLSIDIHSFCIIAHDDDICFVHDSSSLLNQLHASLTERPIFYAKTLYINDSRYRMSFPIYAFRLPLKFSVYPWRIPAFPSFIYPMTDIFLLNYKLFASLSLAGKYSDVIFIDRITRETSLGNSLSIKPANGISYIYRVHSSQDTARFDFFNYVKMLFNIKGLWNGPLLLLVVIDIMRKFLKTVTIKAFCKYLMKSRA